MIKQDIMKTIVKLFIIPFLFIACSNDDDGGNDTINDPIIGTWYLEDIQINGFSMGLDACTLQSYVELKDNNTSNGEYFQINNGSCQLVPTNYPNWTNLGDSAYSFPVPMFGLTSGNVEFVGTTRFRFTSEDFPAGTIVIFTND